MECYSVCVQLQPEKKGIYLYKIAALLAKQKQSESAYWYENFNKGIKNFS